MKVTLTSTKQIMNQGGVADYMSALAESLTELGLPAKLEGIEEIGREEHRVVSLQFVPTGFARHGIIPPRDVLQYSRRFVGSHVHVMLHEIWQGEHNGCRWRVRIQGWLQRRSILRMLQVLRPCLVHTSNPAYLAMLQHFGVEAKLLKIFGNVPLPVKGAIANAANWLQQRGIIACGESKPVLAGVFGTLHPEWNPREALISLREYASSIGKALVFIAIGRAGTNRASAIHKVRSLFKNSESLIETDTLPSDLVGGLLTYLDVAFATSPWSLIGKSGSAAASLELGVPTVVTRTDWQWRRGPTPEPQPDSLLFKYDSGKQPDWRQIVGLKRPPYRQVRHVAAQFVLDLQASLESTEKVKQHKDGPATQADVHLLEPAGIR